MVRVFVVLFFVFTLCLSGCTKSSDTDNTNHIVDKNENIISSIPGDFDGDRYPEYIYAINSSDGRSYIKLVDGNITCYKDLNFKLDNYSSNVQDVNGDGREDFILYSIQEYSQNVYVFSYVNDILNIFDPQTISNHVLFSKSEDGYKVNCGDFNESIQSKEKLNLKFYYTDLDYKEEGPVFDSVGAITTSSGKIIYTVLSTFRIDSSGKINICDLDLKPYVEIDE
jgi:hypothetical protein